MAVTLVQGASRGIGFQFCRHLLGKRDDTTVIASCRSPESAKDLQNLKQEFNNRLFIQRIDVTVEEEIKRAANQIMKDFGKLDLLINSAAMLHPSGKGETSLRDVSQEGLQKTLLTNTTGPLLMAKHFSALLKKGSGLFGDTQSKKHASVLINMSARVGSITDNTLGGWYSYRLSKAALNMATKTLSIELGRGSKTVVCLALHPGTVNTDLSRPYHQNVPEGKLFPAEYSVDMLMNIINGINMNQTGKYFAWDGSEIPF